MDGALTPLLHRTLFIPGSGGRLEALLWSVAESPAGTPSLAALVCHPHPLFGGTMHNKVVYQTAKTLHRFGIPVLRFNFRGVGSSEGQHDKGRGEREDVVAAIDFMAEQYPDAPLLLAGFSFGSWVGLEVACRHARVTEMIGLGLPVASVDVRDFSYLAHCSKPKLLACGEFDTFGPPDALRSLVAQFPPQTAGSVTVSVIRGADHFFAGHLPELDQTITDWLAAGHPELQAAS